MITYIIGILHAGQVVQKNTVQTLFGLYGDIFL
jgi:hypothetical protein